MNVFNDPWQPSGRSTWPDSGSAVEHGYMKLPGKRKMIKVRQTIYEDPGNPFQDELDAVSAARGEVDSPFDQPLPAQPDELSPTGRSFFELDIDYEPFKSTIDGDKGEWRRRSLDNIPPKKSNERSPTACMFRFDSVDDDFESGPESYHVSHTPKHLIVISQAVNSQEPAPNEVRRALHRSVSLAIPKPLPPADNDNYVSPRRFWRRENSMPSMKEQPKEQRAGAPKAARDTRFYGFWDDLMQYYEKRRSK